MSTKNWPIKRVTPQSRQGVIVVLTAFLLTAMFAFVSLSVDTGRVVLTETEMQNGVDAAALAASQEIMAAVYQAGQGNGGATIDSNSIAVEAARQMAATVAEANGVYIDPENDVFFGKRIYDSDTDTWPIQWGVAPYNTVKVVARRDNSDTTAPDGEVKLAFGWAVGKESVPIVRSATAFVESRDIVLALDFSASMNDDSSLRSIYSLGQSQVENTLDSMWDALQAADPKWPGTSDSKFPASGFGKIDSDYGTYYSSSKTSNIFKYLDLDETNPDGSSKYPFPQAGRYSDGSPRPQMSHYWNEQYWRSYISYVKQLSGPYRKRYGYRTLLDYMQEYQYDWYDSEDLWRTPHQPFNAVRNGASLFLDFLEELNFGDEVGLVGYGQYAVQQMDRYDGEIDIDVSADPITSDYSTIDELQRRHQAGEYNGWTAMGDAILKARELLVGAADDANDDGYSRYGSRPTMLVMTDGQTNQKPSGWSLPAGFDWSEWTDYDGDGAADYYTSDSKKQYAFWEATEAVKLGITIHTIAVGEGADRSLMQAIAFAGSGVYIGVPGGTTVAEMESQLRDAFTQIAAKVPAAKLVFELAAAE